MARYIFTLSVCLFTALTSPAQELPDSAFVGRYNQLFNLSNPDSAMEFYEVSDQLQQIAKRDGNMNRYYAILANEVVYEANNGLHLSAIKKATALLEDIKSSNSDNGEYYNYVYKALGSIFEHRGNTQMAAYYYEKALKSLDPTNSGNIPERIHSLYGNLYASLARVNIVTHPDEAWQWNERLIGYSGEDPYFLKPYLAHKAQLYFYKGDRDNFLKAKREYDDFIKSPVAPQYRYEESRLELLENVVAGNQAKALRMLDSMSASNITILDAAIRIHEMMGRQDLSLKDAYKRISLQDSLNNELINDNLNELNVTLGMTKLQAEAAHEREQWMAIVIGLMVIALALLIWRYVSHYRFHKYIKKQNKQLEIALDEAQEVDRMKTTFIQHISHEIHTPLNIVTGFVQVVANPNFELEEKERGKLLQAIDENTIAITNIVNDLLEMSLDGSKQHYRQDNRIVVNDLCRRVLAVAESRNKGRLALSFQTTLPNEFSVQSNLQGVERILKHLLSNAQKFTEQGSVELSVGMSADGDSVQFVVTDTGIGIAEEYHEQVFEQFYKVDTFKQGLGVGLSMSRKIAESLGGNLAIDKNYHDGARLIFTIPAKE